MRTSRWGSSLGVVVALIASSWFISVHAAVAASTPTAASPAPAVHSISAGDGHTCVVAVNSTVSCWGDNGDGELGDGTMTSSVAPVEVAGLTGVVEIATGSSHTCARQVLGQVWCWGFGDALGDGTGVSSPTPVAITGLNDAIAISADSYHTCALRSSGSVSCWGYNTYGELGDGTTNESLVPVKVLGITDVVDVATGPDETCVVRGNGHAECWGSNSYGQLGNGTTIDSMTPVEVTGLTGVTSIDSGYETTCATLDSGEVKCWGNNDQGQLGHGTLTPSLLPVTVAGLTDAASVEVGSYGACARTSSGSVLCWGSSYRGFLGDGTSDGISTIPVHVGGIDDAVVFAVGGYHGCAARVTGAIWCWGDSQYGQVGNGLPDRVDTPVTVPGVSGATKLAAGHQFTCALLISAAVQCWGAGESGQLGSGQAMPTSAPVMVTGLNDVADIAAGDRHACAEMISGTAKCWGANTWGELGDGTSSSSATPVDVSGLTSVARLAAGSDHTCARLVGGSVDCWGQGNRGQLGNGTSSTQLLPTTVVSITTAGPLTAGSDHTCARLTTGEVECWGDNSYGQLGDGTTTMRNAPVAINVATNDFNRIDAGDRHTCAARAGETMCWGSNTYGQLGDGTSTQRSSPVTVIGVGGGVVQAGDDHTCLLNAGAVRCWGGNYNGELGNATFNGSTTPVDVVGVTGALDLTVGGAHSCVIAADATVQCWGSNTQGQLGQPSYFPLPVAVLGVSIRPPAPEVPLVPARLLDTRSGGQTIDGQFAGIGQRGAGSTLELTIAGRGGVPADAAAVVVNVTAVDPTGPGFITVYPCDAPRPLASSLNYTSGQTIPNELITKLSSSGTICLFTLAPTDVVVDATGWLPISPAYTALVPARLLDTRPNNATTDGQFSGLGKRDATSTLELTVGGRGGVPLDAGAAVLNVTVVDPGGPGFVTVYPCDAPRPLASSLNYTAGQTIPNELITKLSGAGTVCLYTLASADLVVDVTGWLPTTPSFTALVPARLLDTRPANATVDGAFAGIGQRSSGSTLELPVSGRGGVPSGASAAVVNVTVVDAAASGFVTVYPCDSPRPLASSLNYTTSATIPNELVTKLSASGTVCLFVSAVTDLLVDVTAGIG